MSTDRIKEELSQVMAEKSKQNKVLQRMSPDQRRTASRSSELWTKEDWDQYWALWNEV